MADRIRILYYIPQLTVGGTERHLCDLVSRLDKDRFEIVVWCPGPWGPLGDEIIASGAEVAKFRIRGLPRYIMQRKFDIFHSYGYGPHFVDALIAKAFGIPIYISSKRNTRHWQGGEKLRFQERIRNYFSDAIIANSEAVKKKSVEVERLRPERITVIHNGIDVEQALPESRREALRSRLGLLERNIVIGTIANLKPVKNHGLLISAFSQVARSRDDVKLVIAGSGSEEKSLTTLAKDLGIDQRVIFIKGFTARFELHSIFDIFVVASVSEGFPNVILEAMACGKPVLAADVGGIGEAVVDQYTGFLFRTEAELVEKMLLVLNDTLLSKEMGAKGKERVRRFFSLQDKIMAHERMYNHLLKGGCR